ncbi:thaumatin [Chytriomyces sp. MP71]|nr:thaumatin [Chytriomyces sp. MP71]
MKGGSVSAANAFINSANGNQAVCGYMTTQPAPSPSPSPVQPSVTGWTSGGNCMWASGCDWKASDIGNAQVAGSQCSTTCAQTSGCTHFSWTSFNGGTCWMKFGSVSQADAVVSTNAGAVCGYMTGSAPTTTATQPPSGPTNVPVNGISLFVVNKCSNTIWPGITAVDGATGAPYFGNAQSSNPAGFQLNSGESKLISLKTNVAALRLWARTGCTWTNNQFVCQVGDCGNPLNNFDGTCYKGGGLGANSLFEMTIDGSGHSWYDLSIVDGYTLPISVTLSGSLQQVPQAGSFSCGNPACRPNINNCPPELIKYNSGGAAIACQSISKAIEDAATRARVSQLQGYYNNVDTRSKTECGCMVGSCAGGTTAEVLSNLKNGNTIGVDRTGYCCSPNNPLYKSDPNIASHICYAENKPKPLNNFGNGQRYDQIFKSICPQAYSWEFDDGNSTYECKGTSITYTVQFC